MCDAINDDRIARQPLHKKSNLVLWMVMNQLIKPHLSVPHSYPLEHCTTAQPSWWPILPGAADGYWAQSGWDPVWPTNVSLWKRALFQSSVRMFVCVFVYLFICQSIYINLFICLFMCHRYVKKIIEDANTSEDTVKLLKFCCWENPLFSSAVLSELLWQIAYSYTYELRPYLDLLLHMLLLEDSWQNHRIHNALKGKYSWWWWCVFGHSLIIIGPWNSAVVFILRNISV